MTDNNGESKYRSRSPEVAELQRRLDATERRDDNLARNLDDVKKTPWTVYLAGASLVVSIIMAFAFIVTTWITLRVDPLKEFTQYNFSAIERSFNLTRDERRDLRTRFDEDIKLLRSEVDTLRGSVFPSKVHEQRWQLYDNAIKTLQDRDSEINETISQLYSPADKFKEIQSQLDQLRDLVDRKFMNGYMAPPPISPPVTQNINPRLTPEQ